jgi:receptor protein-tyrosine kinase
MLAKPTDNVLQIEGSSRGGRHIGAILMDEGKLTASDAEQVLKRQRELGWRFGEAAIELNLITDNDLRQALSKQYEFPYLVSGPEGVSKELIAAWDPFHPVVEELRTVRTQLLIRWFNPGAGRRTLAISSPCAREGRSFIAANLASPSRSSAKNPADRRRLPRAAPAEHLQRSRPLRPRARSPGRRPRPRRRSPASRAFPCRRPLPPNPLELLSRASFGALLAGAVASTTSSDRDATVTVLRRAVHCLQSRRRAARFAPGPDPRRRYRARGARDLRRQRAHRRHADEQLLRRR